MRRSGRRFHLRRAYGRGEHNAWRRGRWRTEFIGLPRHEIAPILLRSGFRRRDVNFIRQVQPAKSMFMPATMLVRDTVVILTAYRILRFPLVLGLFWVWRTETQDFGLYLALVLTLICGLMAYTLNALLDATPGFLTQIGAESITRIAMRIRKKVSWPFDRLALRQLSRRELPELVEANRMIMLASLVWGGMFLVTAAAWVRLLVPMLSPV